MLWLYNLGQARVPHSHVKRSTVARHRLILTHKTPFFFRWFISDVYIGLVLNVMILVMIIYLGTFSYIQDISFYNQSDVMKLNSFFLDNLHLTQQMGS